MLLRVKYASKCHLRGSRYGIKQRQAVNESRRTKGYFSSMKYTRIHDCFQKMHLKRRQDSIVVIHIIAHPPRLTAVMPVKLKTSSVGTSTEGLQQSQKVRSTRLFTGNKRSTEQMELSDSISTVRFPFYSCCFAAAIFCRRNERSPLQVTLQLGAYRHSLCARNI